MSTPGRKSAAAQSTKTVSKDGRPKPPSDLTEKQSKLWTLIVSNEPANFFSTAASQILLKELCRHTTTAHFLASQIEDFETAKRLDEDEFKLYQRYVALRDKETRAIAEKATKLRLTNQSRYTPQAAATAAKNTAKTSAPWDFEG